MKQIKTRRLSKFISQLLEYLNEFETLETKNDKIQQSQKIYSYVSQQMDILLRLPRVKEICTKKLVHLVQDGWEGGKHFYPSFDLHPDTLIFFTKNVEEEDIVFSHLVLPPPSLNQLDVRVVV